MNLIEIFSIIIIHFIADFIKQDEKWAVGKSKTFSNLLAHTSTYSLIWFTIGIFLFPVEKCLIFWIITISLHTITDYFTSRIVSKKFANQEYGSSIPNIGAFTIIGFDQVLHYIQLFLTYYILFK